MDFKKAASELQENGFAVIEKFLCSQEINDLENRMKEILDDLDPAEHSKQNVNDYFMKSCDRISFFFEEGALDEDGNLTVDKHLSVNKIGHALHYDDPVFSRITLSDKMKEMVKETMQFKDPVLCQSMFIFKQPKIGSEVRPHQDSSFTITTPFRLIGAWIPLEDACIDNSCLWMIPGSHKDGVHNNRFVIRNPDQGSDDPDKPNLISTAEPREYDDSLFVPVEMKAGDLVLIHGEVVHKSEPNKSTRSRHAYTFHIFENDGVEFSKKNWLQPTEKGTFVHLLKP